MRMKAYEAMVASPCIANRHPYIYILYATIQDNSFLYVGETEEHNGVIGRLSGHLNYNPPGTFLSKIMEYSTYQIEEVGKVNVIAFDVSEYQIFSGDINKTKRRALEYVIHFEMLKYSCADEVTTPYTVISHVQAQERYINDSKIQAISQKILQQAIEMIPFNK